MEKLLSRDPFLLGKQLQFLKNYLSVPRVKVDDHTFEFIVNHLPEENLGEWMLHHFGNDSNNTPRLTLRNDLPRQMHSEWERYAGKPPFREPLFELMENTADDLLSRSGSPYLQRIEEMKEVFKLGSDSLECLHVLYFFDGDSAFRHAIPFKYDGDISPKIQTIACLLWPSGFSVTGIKKIYQSLREIGLVDISCCLESHVTDFLVGMSDTPLTSLYFEPVNTQHSLPLKQFVQDQEKISFMVRMINSHDGRRPMNILLYGRAGTGKTELAKSLANECERNLYDIHKFSEEIVRSHSNTGHDFRSTALNACRNTVCPRESLIVIDEADDMLNDMFGFGKNSRKAVVNNAMDQGAHVCIWITNHYRDINESTRRRFDFSLGFDSLSLNQRRAVWRNCLSKYGPEKRLSTKAIDDLARTYQVDAGTIDFAVRNSAESPTDNELPSSLEQFLEQHIELLNNGCKRSMPRPTSQYSLKGLNIKGTVSARKCVTMLSRFYKQLRQGSDTASPLKSSNEDMPKNVNLLMTGPPGTGKTEFAKYLAEKLGAELVIKTSADILNCYVGSTEHNIRQAFEEAEREEAILLFDEIDGLLSDRSHAQQSWEVTQVNELLTCMENFHGIFLAATNFRQRVDSASIRRFNLKLEFDYLNQDGKRVFWRKYLAPLTEKRLSPKDAATLDNLPSLTPGDFKVVRDQYSLFAGEEISKQELINALREETKHKPSGSRRSIGFTSNSQNCLPS